MRMKSTKSTIKPKSKIVSKSALYKVKVLTAGKEYSAEAKTISEALDEIKLDTFKAKGILQVEYNGKKEEIVIHPFLLRKMVNKTQRAFFEKRLEILLR